MYVIATFEQSVFLELAITALEQKGIPKDRILAVPLDKRTEPPQLFDTLHRADGISMFDLGAVLGTCLMLLGSVYGYVLKWGPIIWGIIGAVAGLLIGFIIKYVIVKRRNPGNKSGPKTVTSEAVLMIHCHESQWDNIEKILWDNTALGVSRLNL